MLIHVRRLSISLYFPVHNIIASTSLDNAQDYKIILVHFGVDLHL